MKKKVENYNESHRVMDRITDLPECVTSNILSRLVTKEAVRTSILSRDWKHKWTSIYDVNIDIELDDDEEARFVSFYSIVDRVLDSNRDLKLRSFSLDLRNGMHDPHRLERWISKVLDRGVEELRIVAPNTRGKIVLERPTSLTRLELFHCKLLIRTKNCFPSLKRLSFRGIRIMNEQSQNTGGLSLLFPILEQLELVACEFSDVKFVTINAPKLTSFKSCCSSNFTNHVFKILAPELYKFQSYGGMLDTFVLHAPSLYSAALVNRRNVSSKVLALRSSAILLQRGPSLKYLKLSCTTMEALAKWKGVYGFPTFDQLIRLKLYGSDTRGLMELLQVTPCLESLTADAYCYIHKVIQEPLPCCIVSQLKYVHLRGFSGKRFQFDVATWFLENAKKLNTVYLYPHRLDMKGAAEIDTWMRKLGPESSSRVKVMRK